MSKLAIAAAVLLSGCGAFLTPPLTMRPAFEGFKVCDERQTGAAYCEARHRPWRQL